MNTKDNKLYGIGGLRTKQTGILPDVVKSRHIGDISWDKGQGGTLTLGGADNTNGILSIKDSSGDEKIIMDNEGITINTGKLTIKDEDESTVIDSKGLVSTTSFQFDTVVLESQITRSASGWGDATGLSLTFTLSRTANVLILASLSGKNTSLTSSGGQQLIRFDINGTPTGVWNLHGVPGGGGLELQSATIHYVAELPSGSNTIKVQHRWAVLGDAILAGSTGTDNAGSRLSYLVLGK
jgi:hypothetical protein